MIISSICVTLKKYLLENSDHQKSWRKLCPLTWGRGSAGAPTRPLRGGNKWLLARVRPDVLLEVAGL